MMNIGGQRRIVGRNSKVLEIVQGATHTISGEPCRPHQLVCGDPFVRIGIDQTVNELNQLLLVIFDHARLCKTVLCLRGGSDAQRRRKYLDPVFFSGQQM